MSKSVFVLLTVCCFWLQMGKCQLYEGDACTTPNGSGVCKSITECPQAGTDLQKGIRPQICSFNKKTAVVCCKPANLNSKDGDCGAIPAEASKVSRTGRKAWDKCIDFLQYVYPCENITIWEECAENGNRKLCDYRKLARNYKCRHSHLGLFSRKRSIPELDMPVFISAVGGEDSLEKEFPHMALLGFGTNVETASWGCGGTVVSENFVLTAGHCTYSRDYGDIQFVRVGMAKVSSPIDPQRLYRVSQIIKHPDYRPPSKYNDIALLMTATEIIFDNSVYPACLHTGNVIDDRMMMATGWGLLKYLGDSADVLQKVELQKFTTEECRKLIEPSRTQKNGFDPETQLCVGHHDKSRDTCQGDSGGPLQIYNQDVNCMYTVVGVTSFGWGCGIIGSPGVYTRVSHYIPWIESIVWP